MSRSVHDPCHAVSMNWWQALSIQRRLRGAACASMVCMYLTFVCLCVLLSVLCCAPVLRGTAAGGLTSLLQSLRCTAASLMRWGSCRPHPTTRSTSMWAAPTGTRTQHWSASHRYSTAEGNDHRYSTAEGNDAEPFGLATDACTVIKNVSRQLLR